MKIKEHTIYIPGKLNLFLIVCCLTVCTGLLKLGSESEYLFEKIIYGIIFGIIMLPVYSLMHEAEHSILHPKKGINLFLGRLLSCLFIVSFSFIKNCHIKHHKKNRSDSEMWDLYYEHQNKILRYGNLYFMMVGFGYLAIWLSVILFATWPKLVYSRFFSRHKEIAGFLEGRNKKRNLQLYRIECISVILFQVGLIFFMHLNFSSWLIMYLIHGFIWSSNNYVSHAFSPRDVVNGAHNLKVPIWGKFIYLNFNLHLAHHQNPHIPWIHLPAFAIKNPPQMSFLKNYLRLWKGPKVTRELSPVKSKIKKERIGSH